MDRLTINKKHGYSRKKMTVSPLSIDAIINGKKVKTEKKDERENPAHPSEIVGYAPVNTRANMNQAHENSASILY